MLILNILLRTSKGRRSLNPCPDFASHWLCELWNKPAWADFLVQKGQGLRSIKLPMLTVEENKAWKSNKRAPEVHRKKIKFTQQGIQEKKKIQRKERHQMPVPCKTMIPNVSSVVFRTTYQFSPLTNSFIVTKMWYRANYECPNFHLKKLRPNKTYIHCPYYTAD